jgi:hypothetical protein
MNDGEIEIIHYYCGRGRPGAYRLRHIPTGIYVESWTGEEPRHRLVKRLYHELADRVPPGQVSLEASWLTPTVKQLATAIARDATFDHLPILADALEEAGCTDVAILKHCRGAELHTKGCWVLALLLGKE